MPKRPSADPNKAAFDLVERVAAMGETKKPAPSVASTERRSIKKAKKPGR